MGCRLENKTVFLIEDHSLVRGGLRRLLEGSSSLQVVGEADSLEQAVAPLKETSPAVVCLDLSLPGLSGRAAAASLLEMLPEVRILVVSARLKSREVQSLMQTGVMGYISKSASAEEFLVAAETIARGEVYLGREAAASLAQSLRNPHPSEKILTTRLLQVLDLIARGESTKEIADILCLSPKTVEKYRGQILRRLECKNQIQAIEKARSLGLLHD